MSNPERNLCQALAARDDWHEIAAELCSPGDDRPGISEERLRGILGLVPNVFSLEAGRGFYGIAFGGGITNDCQREVLDEICNGDPKLTVSQVAGILNRACWRVKPYEFITP